MQFSQNPLCGDVVMTKTIQIEAYKICSSHQLGLEVERPDCGALYSPFFDILHINRNIFSFYANFSGSIYRAGGSVYEVF